MKNMRKKSVAVLLGLAVTGLVGASAASLGGITTDNLGADVGVVASCDTEGGVNVSFSTGYSGGIPVVTAVAVSDIDAECVGQTISVTLAQGQNALTNPALTGTVASGTETFTLGSPVSAEQLNRVAITISGTP